MVADQWGRGEEVSWRVMAERSLGTSERGTGEGRVVLEVDIFCFAWDGLWWMVWRFVVWEWRREKMCLQRCGKMGLYVEGQGITWT